MRSVATTPAPRVAVKRIGDTVWIFRVGGPIEGDALRALEDTFAAAVMGDATDVVVDLGYPETVSIGAARTLTEMANVMRGRHGALWIAAAWPDDAGYTLRPVSDLAPRGLEGITPALDRALARLPEPDAQPL